MYFADRVELDTRGPRGKTTAKRAKTVRGPEGQYIAQTKDEIATREPGWLVLYEFMWRGRLDNQFNPSTVCYGRFDTEDEASAACGQLLTKVGTVTRSDNGDSYKRRVWVERETLPK